MKERNRSFLRDVSKGALALFAAAGLAACIDSDAIERSKHHSRCRTSKPQVVGETSSINSEGNTGESFTMAFKVSAACERKTLYVTCTKGSSQPRDCEFKGFDKTLR